MGLTKTDLYTDEQVELAAMAKVIGHPARVAILQHLLKVKTCICGEIVEEIGLAQPTISQHLKEMKNIGLIQGSIDGTKVCYCIDPIVLGRMKNLLNTIFNHESMICS
ncbi:MAG: ArsR family transcriptional regulator [Saprospiraceae bacterium]